MLFISSCSCAELVKNPGRLGAMLQGTRTIRRRDLDITAQAES